MLTNLHKSLNIRERYDLMSTYIKDSKEYNSDALSNWRTEMSILSDEEFEEMLKYNDYKMNAFSFAVDKNPSEEINNLYKQKAKESQWYNTFIEIMENTDLNEVLDPERAGMLFILRPFIDFVKKEISIFVSKHDYHSIVSQNILESLIEQFAISIAEVAQKSLVLELNLDRENEFLVGTTPEDRFVFFVNQYKDKDKLIDFFDKYIVLTRLLSTITPNFISNIKVLFNRIDKHKNDILQTFTIQDPLLLTDIKIGQGDTHNKGNTVIELIFNKNYKIIYKPKNLEISKLYNEIIEYFNKKDDVLDMKIVKGIYEDDYSFEEFIPYEQCYNKVQLAHYYERFGQVMAILYLLNASDMHLENLIANGEYPVAIDLETLFQQPIMHALDEYPILKKARLQMFNNVVSTMLLPHGTRSDREDEVGIDLSALDGKGVKINKKILQPVNIGTDEMRYEHLEFKTSDSNNIPYLETVNNKVGYKDYIIEIINGFRNVCSIALNNKKELIELCNDSGNKIARVIVRDTSQYGNILQHSHHPDLLQDMLDREKVLENMWTHSFSNKEIIKHEIEDMLINDIPIFFNKIGTKDVISSNGELMLSIQQYDGKELVINKVNNLTEDEINKQVSVMNISFGLYPEKEQMQKQPKLLQQNTFGEFDLKEEAIRIADDILQNAIVEEDKIMWIAVNPEEGDKWSIGLIDDDFYDGLSGVYLFLHTLYVETQKEEYLDYANRVLKTLNHHVVKNELGMNSSSIGIMHAVSRIKNKKLSRALREELKNQVNYIDDQEIDITHTDYLNGSISLINTLINIYENGKDANYLSLAIKYAEKYIKLPIKEKINNDISFGHGYISIALVFFRLWKCTNNQRYYNLGGDFYNEFYASFEEHKKEEFKDLNFSWCRGILGILIAELEIMNILDNEKHSSVVEALEPLLLNMDMSGNDGLCHGNIAVTEYFLKKYEYSKNEEDLKMAQIIVQNIINRHNRENRFMLRYAKGFKSIGLFTGLSGIGYQMLRVSNPEKIKSILD